MTDLNTIIGDLNETIADVETLQTHNVVSLPATVSVPVLAETRRSIGQLKAARTSLIKALARLNQSDEWNLLLDKQRREM